MSKWIKKYSYSKSAKLRLFCFPYAGGSATVFDNWQELLPADIDVFAIQAPGRNERFNEEPISCLSPESTDLKKGISSLLECALFIFWPQ